MSYVRCPACGWAGPRADADDHDCTPTYEPDEPGLRFLAEFHPDERVSHLDGTADHVERVFGQSFIEQVFWPDHGTLRVQHEHVGGVEQVSMMASSLLASLPEGPSLIMGHISGGDQPFLGATLVDIDVMTMPNNTDRVGSLETLRAILEWTKSEVHWIGDARRDEGLVVISVVSCVGRCETVTVEPATERVVDRVEHDHHARPIGGTRLGRRLWDVLAYAHRLAGSTALGSFELFDDEQ